MGSRIQQRIWLALCALVALMHAGVSFGQIEDCGSEVRIDGGVIAVAPTNNFDGDNILCAMLAARDAGFPTVKLDPGTFTVAHINIDSFNGTLEGATINSTTVVFDNFSVDCQAMVNDGLTPSGIKFIRGEPRVRFMSLVAADPCSTENQPFYMLHFTGQNADGPCGNDVIFGNVDRVSIQAANNPSGNLVGVGVFPEGYELGGCKTTLLGTFKLNRSFIDDVPFGIQTNMKGAAQVDLNFNEFNDNAFPIFIDDANQITTVQFNDFVGTASGTGSYLGVTLLTDDPNAPASNRLVVHSNTFDIVSAGNNAVGAALALDQDGRLANVGVVVTNNTLDVGGPTSVTLSVDDISRGLVSGNTFRGVNLVSIDLFGEERTLTDWAIVGNNFAQASGSLADVLLSDGTSRNIVGPQQGALIADDGNDNVVVLNADNQLTKAPAKRAVRGISDAIAEMKARVTVRR